MRVLVINYILSKDRSEKYGIRYKSKEIEIKNLDFFLL